MDGVQAPASTGDSGAAPSSVQVRYIHSDIFARLAETKDDLTGLIAYGLYQQQKRMWIDLFEQDRGRTPTEQEVKDYCYTFNDSVLHDLRNKADNILFGVAQEMVEEQTAEMQREAFNAEAVRQLGDLKTRIAAISGYKHHVVGHIIGFITLVALVWLATFVVQHEPRIESFIGSQLPSVHSPER